MQFVFPNQKNLTENPMAITTAQPQHYAYERKPNDFSEKKMGISVEPF